MKENNLKNIGFQIKAIGFDIGHTLVHYKNPLNWKVSYTPALVQVIEACGFGNVCIDDAISILLKYNTRENPRTIEFSADVIFGEILDVWQQEYAFLPMVKNTFFAYFQNNATLYPDVKRTFTELKQKGFKLGALTDVAYGMDRELALQDVASVMQYLDVAFTSADIGYRKPHTAGYLHLCEALNVAPYELAYVGDEQKDMEGANKAGCISILINRTGLPIDFAQNYTIRNIEDILTL